MNLKVTITHLFLMLAVFINESITTKLFYLIYNILYTHLTLRSKNMKFLNVHNLYIKSDQLLYCSLSVKQTELV